MLHKFIFATIVSILSFGAFAENPVPPMEKPEGHGPRGGMMANLTDEQKACIKEFGCKMPEHPEMPKGERPEIPEGTKPDFPQGERPDFASGEKPERGKRPEMTEEQKENMECMKKAMESCGIQMPERKERPMPKQEEQ